MAITRVLYISSRTASLFIIEGRRLIDTQVYGHDEDGLIAFSEDLKDQPPYPTRLLVDIIEEEFRVERLPHVLGKDQREMLNRKLINLFRETCFRQAQKQFREETGRRDDVFLISGITNPEVLNPWLQRLSHEHIPVPSMHSLPMLHQELFRIIKPANRYVILISQGDMGGMRQTFFVDGNMKVSRLTPTRWLNAASYLELASSETNRFWNYITSTRLAPEEETVHVTVVGETEFNEPAGKFHANNPFIKFHFVNIDTLIIGARFKGISGSRHGDVFFSLLLASKNIAGCYATLAEKRFHYHHLANRSLITGTAIIWLYVLFTLPLDLFDGMYNYRNLTLTLQQQQRLLQQHQQTINTAPSSPASGIVMQSTVSLHRQMSRLRATPIPYLKTIGQVLLLSRGIAIDEFNWGTTVNPHNFPADEKQSQAHKQNFSYPQSEAQLYPVLLLNGAIDTQRGIRQAVDQINSLKQQIINAGGIQQVDVIRYPLEIDPDKTLSSNDSSGGLEHNERKFSLRIIWEPVP